MPKKVPAEGKLKFSGHIFVGEETTGSAGLGANVYFPPTTHSGYPISEYVEKGEWKPIEGDLVKSGKYLANIATSRYICGVTEENVGIDIDKIGIFLRGKKGKRVVVYVDDIKIEGEVPTEEAYKGEIQRRWAPAKERFIEKINSWEKALEEREKEISSLTNLSSEAEKMKKEVVETPGYFDQLYGEYPPAKKEGNIRSRIKIDYLSEEISLTTHGELKLIAAGYRGFQSGVRYAEAYMSLDKRIIGKRILPEIV